MFNLYKNQLKIKCQELHDENIELKKLLNQKNNFKSQDRVHKKSPEKKTSLTFNIEDLPPDLR